MPPLEKLFNSSHSRRQFMLRMSAAGLGAAAAAMFLNAEPAWAAAGDEKVPLTAKAPAEHFPGIPGRNINEIVLNFALTLEILEADLYRQALNLASGLSLSTPLSNIPSTYKLAVPGGGLSSQRLAEGFIYLKQFAYIESAHREFLHAAVKSGGGTPVSPNPRGYKFASPVAKNMKSILTNILPLEETGVRAYLGALPYLTDLSLATVAAGIYSTEARHSAVVNYTLGLDAGPARRPGDKTVVPMPPDSNTLEYFLPPGTVLGRVAPLFA